jgi:glycerate kinase
VAIVGSREDDIDEVYDLGIDFIQDIITRPMTLSEAIEDVDKLLVEAGKNVGRLMKFGRLYCENSCS